MPLGKEKSAHKTIHFRCPLQQERFYGLQNQI